MASLTLNTSSFIAHFVPKRTPGPLIPFLVIIEIVRSVIRPITLSVRLAANIVAGHILICLLTTPMRALGIVPLIISSLILFIIITLELAVAVIQAYVFMTLSSLYFSESNRIIPVR